ncbi:MAG: membrane-bound lytic murein transglycosylase D [Gammaproteobacteria bacterium]|jgi:membrane-bound lytic murein transglycosylase D
MTVQATLALILLYPLTVPAGASDLFPRPAGLEPDIAFWTDVYTQVDTRHGLIHDSHKLGVRYETIAVSPNPNSRAESRLVDEKKQHYKKILQTLARGKREGLSAEEARVLGLWPEGVSNKVLAKAAHSLRFQLGQADRFREGLIRSGAYKPFIAATLKERGLPKELAALPHVESSFNPQAYSKVGAAGMWQFTRWTGRRYMRVDHIVDERRDPYLATVAAATLLKSNFAATDSWPLALTGYNHGVSGMRRAARQQGSKDIEGIVRNYKSRTFGFASRNFYVAFLAAMQVDQNPEQYFGKLQLHEPGNHVLVKLDNYIDATVLAAGLGLKQSELSRLNPSLMPTVWQGNKYIPKGFTLRLPADSLSESPELAIAGLDASTRFARQLPDVTHTVSGGETLSLIAEKYRLRIADLVAVNDLRSRNRIQVGQVLRLPTKDQASATVVAKAAHDESVEPVTSIEPIVAAKIDAPSPTLTRPKAEVLVPAASAEAVGVVARPTDPITVSAKAGAVVAGGSAAYPGTGLAISHAVLVADPGDYSVAADGSIEIQAPETLGHYADWLELKTQRLRDMNSYKFRRPVVVGQRLKLDYSNVERLTFEARRMAYHLAVQEAFFSRYRVRDTAAHTILDGESLWLLAQNTYSVPIWLLRQHNPDLDLQRIRPGMKVEFPLLVHVGDPT